MAHSPLVLLHGSNSCAAEMTPLADALRDHDLRIPDLLGHGGRPIPERLDIESIADDLERWLDERRIGPAHFVGYSFGGYVALLLALRQSTRVRSVTALATVFRWTPGTVRYVVHLADPERLARPGNRRGGEMERAHGPGWRKVSQNNRALFAALGEQAPLTDVALSGLGTPVLVLSGATDPLVPETEARHLAKLLPNARLGLWPWAAHPLRDVPLRQVARAIGAFTGQVEEDRFVPGPPLRLEQPLALGGLAAGDVQIAIGRRD
ncbi:MAG TPA: alpha/beta fold hydrolase [Allosphingosinicella sp.]|nr:alpha/beta fold hydrolase [Allosphingosinicella sp.]